MRLRLAALLLVTALAAAAPAHAATAVTAPTKVVKVGKQKVGYRTFGTGRPLVLIMGLGGTMGSWDPTFLDALAAAGHQIVLLDNEGVGKTAALPGKLTIRRMGDTAAGLIAKLELKKPDVAGWSMGGMIAQSLAVRHPKSVRRLILMATAPGDGGATAPTPEALKALTGPPDVTVLLGLLFPADQAAALQTYVADITARHPFEGIAPAAQAAKQTAASGAWLTGQDKDGKRVAKLALPTLIGGGELDPLLPFPNQQHLAQIIKGSKLVSYPDASHGFLFQHQAEFVPQLLEFLK
ncbi:MAG: hypothetical protein QOJ29_4917 [Thermoleophilaceae bacterium]|nr:hypothetical protein [Thermoleophilaceae bacterium]